MKHSSESLISIGGIMLMAFLSCLFLPAPSLGSKLAQTLISRFHLQDINQLYTIVFCLWFLLLGCVEFAVIRFAWRKWFAIS